MSDDTVVLVVEDEKDLADLYSNWLSEEYEVRTAYSGEEAVEKVDEDVDAVLLDRRLPGISGDEFLKGLRQRGYDCSVAMVSAVEPDFDILEMGFDDYLVKPASKEDLLALVENMLSIEETSADTQEYFTLLSKKRALEKEKAESDLRDSEEYSKVVNSVESFRNSVVAMAEDILSEPGGANGNSFDVETVYQEALEQWRKRLESLDEEDPLHAAAVENVNRYENLLESNGGGAGSTERAFLKTVADSFVADDVWLDSRVLEALNYVFYDKFDDTFVIERTPLSEDAELSSAKRYEVSQAVRERARQELEGMEAE